MSRQLITEYRSDLDRIRSASGSQRESVIREAFKDLLKRWGKSRDLIFLAEHEYLTPTADRRYIDGALVHSIRVPFGYWEAKDTNDDLDEEIRKKTAIGYPRDNIIYEDTRQAVLIQNKREVARAAMDDTDALFHLLELFFAYERASEVMHAWHEYVAAGLPDEITTVARMMQIPPLEEIPEIIRGKSFTIVQAAYLGNERDGAELIRPLTELGPDMNTFAMVGPNALGYLAMDDHYDSGSVMRMFG